MSYDSRTIANYLIRKAAEESKPLTPLQIIKLVYISHGWNLALRGKPLIDDDIEAWKYGPVIRALYRYLAGTRDPRTEPIPIETDEPIADEDKQLLDEVHKVYGKFNGIQLSQLTHQEGTPWQQTISTFGPMAIIPQDLIRSHFSKLRIERSKS